MTLRDEAVPPKGIDSARSKRWAIWHHQFDLVRQADGVRYLRRYWIVKTPWFGIILHRMDGPDARTTLHDHPFGFVSIPLRGGYIERRLIPRTMTVDEQHVVRWWSHQRAGVDAHAIHTLLRVPTYTLLFVGPHRRAWGFWQSPLEAGRLIDGEWLWTDAHAFDSGHYVPLPDGTR